MLEYIAYSCTISIAARGAGDVRTIIIIIIIIIIIYRLRTFNSSMWGSLRLAPIMKYVIVYTPVIVYRPFIARNDLYLEVGR